jgi:hypothetical protein
VARLCSEGLFRLRVEQTFSLEQTAKAQEVSAKETLNKSSYSASNKAEGDA